MSNSKKPADDQPYEFNLDGYVNNLDLPSFRFPYRGGQWEMDHFEALDSWEINAAIRSGDDEKVLAVAMGKERFAEFRKNPLPQAGMKELLKKYFAHSGVDVGELLGSTDS